LSFLELHKLHFTTVQIHLELQFLCRTAHQESPDDGNVVTYEVVTSQVTR